MSTDLRIKLPPPSYKVERIEQGRSRFYRATKDDGEFIDGPGVTTFLGSIAKPALVTWAANQAAENIGLALRSKLDGLLFKEVRIDETWIDEIVTEGKKKPAKIKNEAADLGTLAHEYFDAFIRGEQPKEVIQEIEPAIDAFNQWVEKSDIHPVVGDTKVFSLQYQYGGALDGLAIDDYGNFILLDWKTSSGIWTEYAFQVAAYCQAFRETYGITPQKAVIVRFSKKAPVEFEVKEVANLEDAFSGFLAAKKLYEMLKKKLYI